MNRQEFAELTARRLLVLDGATGTELAKRGLPQGVAPELWVLEHPEAILDVQREYRRAGADIVYTCTFGGNRAKLAEYSAGDRVHEVNRDLAALSRQAGAGLVFGDLAPTGLLVEPFGDLPFEECVEIYKEQIAGLLAGGVDGLVIETMLDAQEARAALLAARESCDLPVLVSLTFGEDGRTLTGADPLSALVTFQALGAAAFGCNCSTGPQAMLQIIQALKPYATVPLLAKPNAGLPVLRDGRTVFDLDPEAFARHAPDFAAAGVNLLGGCCGTTPEHIRRTAAAVAGCRPQPPRRRALAAVSSPRRTVLFGPDRGL